MAETPPNQPRQGNRSPAGPRVLFLFVDGFGWPTESIEHSVYAPFPTLTKLFRNHAVPIDATLGVPGRPQSATGQTALFTGRNAPRELGRHVEGFPNASLRTMVEADNLFLQVQARGGRCAFANAYLRHPGADMPLALRSVTTVMTLRALHATRNREELLAGRAVFHDITRETAEVLGIHGLSLIPEATAAEHLLAVLREVDLCLFEFFLTDHIGHRGDDARRRSCLETLDRFLHALLEKFDPRRELLVLTSDHGNIEDPTHGRHTDHPVPWITVGQGADTLRGQVRSLLDVTPALSRCFG